MNFDKLFKTINLVLGVRDIVTDKDEAAPRDASTAPSAQPDTGGPLERTLTNVLVAALKEAFDRDHARLELERTQIEEQKRRADEAMRHELRRQTVDRELGRLRLLAGTALVGWIVSVILFVVRVSQTTPASMIVFGLGFLLLLGSLGAAFTGQGRLNSEALQPDRLPNAGTAGVMALWLLLGGLALSAASLF